MRKHESTDSRRASDKSAKFGTPNAVSASARSSAHDLDAADDDQPDEKATASKPPPTQCKKRPKFVDRSPKFRTAMGDYIVPEGCQPLTCLARRTIGPADYTTPPIQLTRYQSPEWSIPSRNIYAPKSLDIPAPNAYSLPDDILLQNNFSLGKRIRPNRKAIAGACRRGPTYRVKNYETGRHGPKYTIPRAAKDKPVGGPPNSLVMPQDSPGFKTPGAEPYSEDGVVPHAFHANFTSKQYPKNSNEFNPSPAKYRLPELDKGLQKSLGLGRPDSPPNEVPGPNEYDVRGNIADEGPACTIKLPRKNDIDQRRAPSPCAYMREREYDHKVKPTMGYMPMSSATFTTPAPNAYDIVRKTKNEETPSASIKSRNKLPYPTSILSGDLTGRSPGPAAHSVPRLPETRDKGASFKKRVVDNPDPIPGPSDYGRLDCDRLSTKPNAPAYSMRTARCDPTPGPNPGPAKYATTPLNPGLGATIKSRHRTSSHQKLPAPNAYVPREHCTRCGPLTSKGISLSSRRSPFVYSGLKQPVEL